MIAERPATEDRQKLEEQIAETTAEMATVGAKLVAAQSRDTHDKLQGDLRFLETRRWGLIDARMQVELARHQRLVDDATLAAVSYVSPMPELLVERDQTRIRGDEIEKKIRDVQTTLSRYERALKFSEQSLATFQREGAAELRARLEALGS